MKKATFYIGLNDKTTKKQVVTTKQAMVQVQKLSSTIFWWATISPSLWVFMHENGEIVKENSIRLEVYDFGDLTKWNIETFVNTLKQDLNQESILVEIEDKQADFM